MGRKEGLNMRMKLETFGETVKHSNDLIAGYYSALFGVNEEIEKLEFIEKLTEEEKAKLRTKFMMQKYIINKISRVEKIVRLLPIFTALLGLKATFVFYYEFVDPKKYKNLKELKDIDEKSLQDTISEIRITWDFFYESYFVKRVKTNEK